MAENIDEIVQKIYNTKKTNDSFKTNKQEQYIFEQLCNIFNHVERQYKSNVYPFNCDFYIPSKDLYNRIS